MSIAGAYLESYRPEGYGPEAPVQVFQRDWEFSTLLELFRDRQPRRILEVGSYHGGTLYHWLHNATKNSLVVSVDTYTAADNRDLYPEWANGHTLEVIQGDSASEKTVERVAEHAPYEWVFIDADHLYENVKADWENYQPMCGQGGIIALHDIYSDPNLHPEIEVNRLWREIQARGYITQELVCNTQLAWSGIGVVYL